MLTVFKLSIWPPTLTTRFFKATGRKLTATGHLIVCSPVEFNLSPTEQRPTPYRSSGYRNQRSKFKTQITVHQKKAKRTNHENALVSWFA
ncbi:hypothetical protein [Lactiplantibacillus pentosus]|nr:hypothetical protein [Lactiplantibacillus pentosus]